MMNDHQQDRLAELRLKIRRIAGHKTLAAKQEASLDRLAQELVQEAALIEGLDDLRRVLTGS